MDIFNLSEKGLLNSLSTIHSLKSGKQGCIYNSKKLLVFTKIGGVFQPNICEKGIFSMPEIKYAYPLRQGVQCPGI